jgi:ankyrin repeat protein
LMWACDRGHAACVEILLGHIPEAQVLATNERGWSALIFACNRGHAACVEILLGHVPNDQARRRMFTKNRRSALMIARDQGHAACVEVILKHTKHGSSHWLVVFILSLLHMDCVEIHTARDI